MHNSSILASLLLIMLFGEMKSQQQHAFVIGDSTSPGVLYFNPTTDSIDTFGLNMDTSASAYFCSDQDYLDLDGDGY